MWVRMNSKKRILITAFIFLFISSFFYKNHAFSFRFVDEEDNFAIGKYISKGEVIYDDIITNHQPLTYIFSSLVQSSSNINSVYLLVNKHREAMIVWSLAWSILLVAYFGLEGLTAVLIYELTKIYLLGNLFLAEAQVVYPLMFLSGLVFSEKKLNNLELFFSGLCLCLSIFLLSPIWPAIGLLFLLILYQNRSKLTYIAKYFLIGISLPMLFISKFASLPGYLHYAIYANFVYTIPNYHAESWPITISKAFLTPLLVFFPPGYTPTSRIIQVASILLVANLLLLISKGKYFKPVVFFVLLGLCNIRFIYPGEEYYTGFHLLPWYAVLILITVFASIGVFKKKGNSFLKVINLVLLIFILGLSINFTKTDLFQKRNILSDYNINYSTHSNRGDAVKIMKDPRDTLFVSPNAWIVYWQSDVNHLSKLYGYYPWMVGIPEVHSSVLETFLKTPPTFFYCENCKGLDLEKFLNNYKEIKSYGGQTMLYVLRSKFLKLTRNQLDKLEFYGFTFD